LRKQEILQLSITGYKLASSFCWARFSRGGVGIFARNDMEFDEINLEKLCNEKTFEICAIKIIINTIKLILCCIYKAPSGNLNQFFNLLERTMNSLYQSSVAFLICGYLNINHLKNNMDKQKLESIMETFNLTQVVNFPTRIFNSKGTLIDSLL
jgi:exonuclease III